MSIARTSLFRLLCPALLLTLGLTLTLTLRPSRAAVAAAGKRQLSFDERVVYQRAIEDVYRRHRAATSQAKPALTAEMSALQSAAKVAGYLRKSRALASVWQRQITGEQLQAEMDRIARNSKKPTLLRELYQALNNDPLLIAECLARPTLVEREIRASYARDVQLQGKERHKTFEQWWARAEERMGLIETMPAYAYRLQTIAAAVACTNDTWRPTTLTGAPAARIRHTAVWTGAEMIVWGGASGSAEVGDTGGRYNPATDAWTSISAINAPAGRQLHTAVWTGVEMIVWGGSGSEVFNSGGRYNPATDTWTPTSIIGAPTERSRHTAVWTGTEMIIWGGGDRLNTGGRYNPTTNTWTATSLIGAPAGRNNHSAVWTGTEMIVWGGSAEGLSITNTGGRYNPATDSWTATSTLGAPKRRLEHSAVWTGTEMIVWGGEYGCGLPLNTGGRYDPATDSWKGVSMTLAPTEREDYHRAVWTGTEMIVWGGVDYDDVHLDTGGRYNPATDSWTFTSVTGAPMGRDEHTAVWTGSEMIVWGGAPRGAGLNTGGVYCAQAGGAVNTSPTIVGTSLTRTAGSPAANAQIASVGDAEDAPGLLTVTVNGGASATASGVTVSDLSVNSSGQVTATINAACTAMTAAFTLRVTDGGGLSDEATLAVTVNANTPPSLGIYPATLVMLGGGATVIPNVPPSDNGSIVSLTATAPSFAGTFTGNPTTGVITVTDASPAGNYTVTVTATDNCGQLANSSFTLNVLSCQPVTATLSGGGTIQPGGSTTLTVTLTGGSAPYTVTLNNNGGTRTGASPLQFTISPASTTTYEISAATEFNGCPVTASGSGTITVVSDTTPPTLTCPGNQTGVINGTSGPVIYAPPTVNDNQPGATFTCTPASGSNFALGVTTVNCTARDQVGNTAPACSFTVTVRQPRPASKDLIAKVRALAPSPLTTAQANQLVSHLELANSSLERGQSSQACTHLQNFVNGVNALVSSGPLTMAQSQALIDYANKIRTAIGCSPG